MIKKEGEIAFDSANKEIKIGSSRIFDNYLDITTTQSLSLDSERIQFGNHKNTWLILDNKIFVRNTGTYVTASFDRVSPMSGGLEELGSENTRWGYIYLKNQPNVSSDKRYKRNIHDIDPLLLDCFEELSEKGFVTKHDDKFSFGYIAQDVERCLYKYIVKVWGYDEANEWLPKFKVLQQSESYKSLLYAEVQVIMQAVARRKIDRLENEVSQLQREFDTLTEILKEKEVI